MTAISLKQHEKLAIKLSHRIPQGCRRRLDLYFSLPKEMSINSNTLTEHEYFNAGITGRRAYYTQGLHLPLLHTRFASRMKRGPEEYKTNLNQFAYQYIVALDTDISEALQLDDSEHGYYFYDAALVLSANSLKILKKMRRNAPDDEKLQALFANVDNYLSWYTEQSLLAMLAKKPRQTEYADERAELLAMYQQEHEYRLSKNYNSAATLKDPNRIANKMRLLRRLIEHSVIFRAQTKALGTIRRKLVTGVATALLMMLILTLIIETRGALHNLTALMIVALAGIYGVREVFKDDLKNMLLRWISKGKPKWSRQLKDSLSKAEIAQQLVWLDYIKSKQLPAKAKELLARRHSQNKQSAQLLHYRNETRVSRKNKFQAGYETIEETLIFSLRPLARYIERGSGKVYEQNNQRIHKTTIERRYQLNIVVAMDQGSEHESFQRFKVTLNRSGIIDIEQARTPSAWSKSQ